MKKFGIHAVLSCVFVFAACSQGANLPVSPAASPMPIVEERRGAVGDVYVFERIDGSRFTSTITSVEGDRATVENDDGCIYVSRRNGFAPLDRWHNCSGTGSQDVVRIGESIFPLQIGKTESWEYSGIDNQGRSWEGVRNCSVESEVRVTVPAGAFDTYYILCSDPVRLREWFVRADGVAVQWAFTRKTGSADQNGLSKLVSITPSEN